MNDGVFGFVAGIDDRIDDDSLIGAAAGLGRTEWDTKDGLGTGRADALQLGLYGTTRIDTFAISGAVAFARYDATTDRMLELSGANAYRAKFDADSEAVRLEAGRRFVTDGNLGLTPYAEFQGLFLQTPSYAEATLGGSPLYALDYAGKSQFDITHDLGLQFDGRWQANAEDAIDLNLQVGWVHQYEGALSDVASFATFAGSNFTVYGTRGPKNAGRLVLGGTTTVADRVSLAMRAETLLSGTSQSYGGSATLAYRW